MGEARVRKPISLLANAAAVAATAIFHLRERRAECRSHHGPRGFSRPTGRLLQNGVERSTRSEPRKRQRVPTLPRIRRRAHQAPRQTRRSVIERNVTAHRLLAIEVMTVLPNPRRVGGDTAGPLHSVQLIANTSPSRPEHASTHPASTDSAPYLLCRHGSQAREVQDRSLGRPLHLSAVSGR